MSIFLLLAHHSTTTLRPSIRFPIIKLGREEYLKTVRGFTFRWVGCGLVWSGLDWAAFLPVWTACSAARMYDWTTACSSVCCVRLPRVMSVQPARRIAARHGAAHRQLRLLQPETLL